MSSSQRFWTVAVLALLVAAGGCGAKRDRASVSGTVTCKGVAVKEGVLVFSDEEWGDHVVVPIKNDGSYAIHATGESGLYVGGIYRVAVTPPPLDPPKGTLKKPAGVAKSYADIPAKYRSLKTTDVPTLEIKGSDVTFNVEMK
jgi:hypothetical protein